MAIAVVVLLISTLTSVGLVALWAATSRRSWYVRAAAPVTMIGSLALVPAIELLLALTIEAAIVAARAWIWRRSKGHAAGRMRFSMATLLAAMTLVAVGLALVENAEKLNDAWQSIAVIGLGGAGAVLLGAWAATVRGYRVVLAAVTALLLSAALAAGVARADWFAPSLIYSAIGWPPNAMNTLFMYPWPDFVRGMWYAILPSVTAVVFVVVRLVMIAHDSERRDGASKYWGRRMAATLAAALSVAVALPGVAALFEMLTPNSVPVVTVPQPNALDDFMAAGEGIGKVSLASGMNFYNCDPYYMSRDELVGALASVAPSMRRLHDGLGKSCLLPIDYRHPEPLSDEYFGHMHCIRQALLAEARLAELDGDLDRSLTVRLDLLEFGYVCRRGGLLNHLQAGAKGAAEGVFAVQQIRDHLSQEQCLAVVARVEALEAAAEPFVAFAHREHVWQLHANGWHGRLHTILSSVGDRQSLENYRQSFLMEQTKIRLFNAHLLLRAYVAEHDGLPESWEQVTQAELPALPQDPWDAAGQPLRFNRQGKSYLLYSVGPNGVDDRGVRPANVSFYGLQQSGDYHIDLFGRD